MDQKFELKHNFWSKYLQRLREIWHLHIISWVRRTRDITGFLSDPSYAMILTKMAKFFTKSFSFLISDSYLFCHRVNEANINVLLLSNTCESKQIWDFLENMFCRSRTPEELRLSFSGFNFYSQIWMIKYYEEYQKLGATSSNNLLKELKKKMQAAVGYLANWHHQHILIGQ